ncbi:hypothetical protein NGM44_01145 [Moraxella sp. FZFQ2102]|uniref:hypothetical protein n=1 Tax=Moraxella sp. FZFQ2102 TaxID=2953752 RepID=UPI00209BE404|nr:hypothetical protein [Moraxella sp. FZFQ2102]USZ15035.1 hypothetical protein NGM44_01145 [Moraxella sp. FZFQ2102]
MTVAPPFFLIYVLLLVMGISVLLAIVVDIRLLLRIKKTKSHGYHYQITRTEKLRLMIANIPALLSLIGFGIIDYQGYQLKQRYQIQDLYRYATLSSEKPYGAITLPIGTHVEYDVPYGGDVQNNANAKILSAKLPAPMLINGISVIYINTRWQITVINTEPFTPSELFVDAYDRSDYDTITCPAYSWVRFDIGFEQAQKNKGTLTLDGWKFEDCNKPYDFVDKDSYVAVSYWKDGKLIRGW